MARTRHGRTASGLPISDELIAKLAASAEAGYDVDATLTRHGGRPRIGTGPATVESVRPDPELRSALVERAQRDNASTSSIVRSALREYLDVA